jgi:hypothetical protein
METGLFETGISSVCLEIIHDPKPGGNNRLHTLQETRAVDSLTLVVATYR